MNDVPMTPSDRKLLRSYSPKLLAVVDRWITTVTDLQAENARLRKALTEMESMYSHCWDLVDSGDKLMMAGSVARFDEACRVARIELGQPLWGDNGEVDEDGQ